MDYLRVIGLCLLMFWVVGCQKEEAAVGIKGGCTTGTVSRGLDGQADVNSIYRQHIQLLPIWPLIRNMPSLQEIHAEAPHVDDEDLAVLAQDAVALGSFADGNKGNWSKPLKLWLASKSLRHLDLSGAVGITDDGLKTLSGHAGTSCAEAVPHTADGYDCRCDHFVAETGRTVAGRDIHNRSATIATNSRATASRKLNRLSIGSDSDYRQCHFGAIAEVQ